LRRSSGETASGHETWIHFFNLNQPTYERSADQSVQLIDVTSLGAVSYVFIFNNAKKLNYSDLGDHTYNDLITKLSGFISP
jgi:hypothetical protein